MRDNALGSNAVQARIILPDTGFVSEYGTRTAGEIGLDDVCC